MNVFAYSTIAEKNWKNNLANMTPYEPKYTFYGDFSIAEFCEAFMSDRNAVINTYNNVEKSWGSSIEAITEVCLVLNHKIWSFYYKVDSEYMKCGEEWRKKFLGIYSKLYDKCEKFILKKYGKDEKAMQHFYSVTD